MLYVRMDGIKVNDQDPEVKLEGAKFRLYSDSSCTKEYMLKKQPMVTVTR